MSIRIPALEGYFGGKGGSGTYQKIINLIPPHNTFIVPFLGHCGVTRNIRPCQNWYLNDLDPDVHYAWFENLAENRRHYAKSTIVLNSDFSKMFTPQMDRDDVVYYVDPPYLRETRKSNHTYDHELDRADHENLLQKIKQFNFAKMLISTYDNALYYDILKGWNKISFNSRTRAGTAVETVYFNFEKPEILHDWRYMGNTYRKREKYKLKRDNLVQKFERMSPLERNYFMDALRDPATSKTEVLEEFLKM